MTPPVYANHPHPPRRFVETSTCTAAQPASATPGCTDTPPTARRRYLATSPDCACCYVLRLLLSSLYVYDSVARLSVASLQTSRSPVPHAAFRAWRLQLADAAGADKTSAAEGGRLLPRLNASHYPPAASGRIHHTPRCSTIAVVGDALLPRCWRCGAPFACLLDDAALPVTPAL